MKLQMTQGEFAARVESSVNTLGHWEHGKRQLEGPFCAYLSVIERAPRAAKKAPRAA